MNTVFAMSAFDHFVGMLFIFMTLAMFGVMCAWRSLKDKPEVKDSIKSHAAGLAMKGISRLFKK